MLMITILLACVLYENWRFSVNWHPELEFWWVATPNFNQHFWKHFIFWILFKKICLPHSTCYSISINAYVDSHQLNCTDDKLQKLEKNRVFLNWCKFGICNASKVNLETTPVAHTKLNKPAKIQFLIHPWCSETKWTSSQSSIVPHVVTISLMVFDESWIKVEWTWIFAGLPNFMCTTSTGLVDFIEHCNMLDWSCLLKAIMMPWSPTP
jgi:hypothetical protein